METLWALVLMGMMVISMVYGVALARRRVNAAEKRAAAAEATAAASTREVARVEVALATARKRESAATDTFFWCNHEVRNALQGIHNSVELSYMQARDLPDFAAPDEQDELADLIDTLRLCLTHCNSTLVILEDCLKMAKTDSLGIDPAPPGDITVHDVFECVNAAVQGHRQLLPSVQQQDDLALRFSAPDFEAVLCLDVSHVLQVLVNLTLNAVKFTKAGNIHLTCATATAPRAREMLGLTLDDFSREQDHPCPLPASTTLPVAAAAFTAESAGVESSAAFAAPASASAATADAPAPNPNAAAAIADEADARGVMFLVTDTGCGMTAQQRSKLFAKPYTQVNDDVSQRNQGFGVGLYLCAQIVRALKGTIGCLSNEHGPGSTFWVWLPMSGGGGGGGGDAAESGSSAGAAELLVGDGDGDGDRRSFDRPAHLELPSGGPPFGDHGDQGMHGASVVAGDDTPPVPKWCDSALSLSGEGGLAADVSAHSLSATEGPILENFASWSSWTAAAAAWSDKEEGASDGGDGDAQDGAGGAGASWPARMLVRDWAGSRRPEEMCETVEMSYCRSSRTASGSFERAHDTSGDDSPEDDGYGAARRDGAFVLREGAPSPVRNQSSQSLRRRRASVGEVFFESTEVDGGAQPTAVLPPRTLGHADANANPPRVDGASESADASAAGPRARQRLSSGRRKSLPNRVAGVVAAAVPRTSSVPTKATFSALQANAEDGASRGATRGVLGADCGESSGNVAVLVVDDDAVTRLVLGALLRRYGCHVAVAKSVAEAQEQLHRHPAAHFDLILTDFNMADVDNGGVALAQYVRGSEHGAARIVGITGGTAAPVRGRRGGGAGDSAFSGLSEAEASLFDAILLKPVRGVDIRPFLGTQLA